LEVLKMTKVENMIVTREMLEVAKKLLKANVSMEIIAESTSLDIDKIKELQEQESENNDN